MGNNRHGNDLNPARRQQACYIAELRPTILKVYRGTVFQAITSGEYSLVRIGSGKNKIIFGNSGLPTVTSFVAVRFFPPAPDLEDEKSKDYGRIEPKFEGRIKRLPSFHHSHRISGTFAVRGFVRGSRRPVPCGKKCRDGGRRRR